MWSLMTQMGSTPESKLARKAAGFHFFGPCFNPIPNKQFSYLKCNTSDLNVQTIIETSPNNPPVQCNKKKRRKKRRKKCQQPPRQRTISVESEDSFVIFFEEKDTETTTTTDSGSSDSIIRRKKVCFVNDEELCEVHPMVVWSYAYQAARKGPWEEFARDRCRFRERIQNIETQIRHVFQPEHREKIYQERFA